MYSIETQQKIAVWRAKAAQGGLTLEENKEIIALLRADRKTAIAQTPAAKRKKAKKEVKSADDLLKELDGL